MSKISIIVPIYNVELYLHKCIDSILNQTFVDFECILVDDGSIDSSGDICDEYAKKDIRIKVIHKKNGGLASARNAGLDIATGEYIMFLDSDDMLHHQAFELLIAAADKFDCSTVTMNNLWVPSLDNITEPQYSFENIDCKLYRGKEIRGNIYRFVFDSQYKDVITAGLFGIYRKECFDNIRFDEELRFAEDVFTIVDLNLHVEKVVHMDVPLYYYNLREGSLTRSTFSTNKCLYLDCLLRIIALLDENSICDVEKFQYLYLYEFFNIYIMVKQAGIKVEFEKHKKVFRKNIHKLWHNKYVGIKEKIIMLSFLFKAEFGLLLFGRYEQNLVAKRQSLLQ